MPDRIADWKYWDAAALVAAILVFVLLLLAHEGPPDFVGWALLGGALVIFAFGTFFSSRQGDARLSKTGGLLIVIGIVVALPAIFLTIACLLGDCV
ncbi:MAG: hypothetical protein H2056_01010 [Sphingopyxis sp.]|nr:hypothetical protein [Sphingopyxis sp.]